MSNFWTKLPRDFTILAPMDDVTDVVFRQIVAENARPDVFFTEFTNCDGICSAGREKLLPRLKFTEDQRPIVAQIWGTHPETYFETAKLIQKMGFDGIDINMGCPEHKVIKQGACSALINNPELAKQIIQAVKKGAPKLPLSVKTRLGLKTIETDRWISFLLEQDLAAITIHGRTAKEMSKVAVHWDEIAKAVKLRDLSKKPTLIIGNGDILSMDESRQKILKTGIDGVMIGRGIFANPWVFEKEISIHTTSERIQLAIKHLTLFDKTYGDTKNYNIMKKFFKSYINNFDGAAEFRAKLMETKTALEAKLLLTKKLT